MMNRDLTHHEVESLLTTSVLEVGASPLADSVDAKYSSSIVDPSLSVPSSHVASLDSALCEMGECWSASLRQAMRGDVASQVIRAYLTSHDDLPQIFESPACVEVMESDSLDGFVFLQIDRALALSMIDRILGGGTHPAPRVRRPLTEIETSLLQRITERMRDALSNALQLESTHRLRTVAIESQPERLPRPDNGEMALIDATLSVPRTQGHYRVGMPLAMLDRLADTRCVPSHAESESVVQNLPLEGLAVIAGNVRLRSDEAHALHVGQTVFADRTLPRVYVNRKLMYSGQLGTSGEKKAVRIDTVHERAKQAEEAEAPRNSVVLR